MAQDFTVDRNSTKWVLGSDGYLTEYANDEAAIEFNPDGSYKGVLVEPESTQLLGGDTHTPTTQTITVAAAEHTLSFYGTGSVVLSGAATGTLTGSGTSAERVSLTFTPSAGSLTLTVSGSPEYWQLEVSPIATSYIRNAGAVGTSVSRIKDDIYITGASSLIGQTEGTLFVEVDWKATSGTRQYLTRLQSSTVGGDHLYIRLDDSSDVIRFQLVQNGSAKVIDTTQSSVKSGIYKLAFAYASGDSKLVINGAAITPTTNNAFAFTSTLNEIYFGQNTNGLEQANMHIRTVALYKTRLSDAECEALTT